MYLKWALKMYLMIAVHNLLYFDEFKKKKKNYEICFCTYTFTILVKIRNL